MPGSTENPLEAFCYYGAVNGHPQVACGCGCVLRASFDGGSPELGKFIVVAGGLPRLVAGVDPFVRYDPP